MAAVGDLDGRPVVAVPFRTDRSCDVLHRAASDLPGYTGGLTRPPARRPWRAPEAAHGSGRLRPGRAMGAARIAADHTAGRGGRAISPGNAGVARGRWRKARAGQLRGGRAWAPHPLPGTSARSLQLRAPHWPHYRTAARTAPSVTHQYRPVPTTMRRHPSTGHCGPTGGRRNENRGENCIAY